MCEREREFQMTQDEASVMWFFSGLLWCGGNYCVCMCMYVVCVCVCVTVRVCERAQEKASPVT